jgi:hypothetical protein
MNFRLLLWVPRKKWWLLHQHIHICCGPCCKMIQNQFSSFQDYPGGRLLWPFLCLTYFKRVKLIVFFVYLVKEQPTGDLIVNMAAFPLITSFPESLCVATRPFSGTLPLLLAIALGLCGTKQLQMRSKDNTWKGQISMETWRVSVVVVCLRE